MMERPKTNKQLQLEVREQISREPLIDSNAIGITADHGLVFLSGHVLGVSPRRLAEDLALRVDGVHGVVDELKIRPGRWGTHDADLASVATDSLKQLIGLPDGRVKVVVREGKVRLKGTVSCPEEKAAIVATVWQAIGCHGALDNAISIDKTAVANALPTLPEPAAAQGPPTVADRMIVVRESYTDEGIPMSHVHHREFPEISGEGETTGQGVIRLAHQLDRAREHAREVWQRNAIDQAIQDVKTFHSSMSPEKSAPPDRGGFDDNHQRLGAIAEPALGAASR